MQRSTYEIEFGVSEQTFQGKRLLGKLFNQKKLSKPC